MEFCKQEDSNVFSLKQKKENALKSIQHILRRSLVKRLFVVVVVVENCTPALRAWNCFYEMVQFHFMFLAE